jgi:hypothetical protein
MSKDTKDREPEYGYESKVRSLTYDEILDWIESTTSKVRLSALLVAVEARLEELGLKRPDSQPTPKTSNVLVDVPSEDPEDPNTDKSVEESKEVPKDTTTKRTRTNVHGQTVKVLEGSRQTVQPRGTPPAKPGKPGLGSVKTLLRKAQKARQRLRDAEKRGDTEAIKSLTETLQQAEARLEEARKSEKEPSSISKTN